MCEQSGSIFGEVRHGHTFRLVLSLDIPLGTILYASPPMEFLPVLMEEKISSDRPADEYIESVKSLFGKRLH